MNQPAEDFVDRNEILPLMGVVKKNGDWLMALCPAHADGTKHGGMDGASLGLSSTGVLRCFAGCDFKDVMTALRGTSSSRPAMPAQIRQSTEKLVRLYSYTDAEGTVIAEKGRFETAEGRKTFKWRMPGSESWSGLVGLTMADMPLYGLTKLLASPEPVYFVEGEKACEACWDRGLLAVTHGGGASTKDFGQSLEPLKGRQVYLWADNDPPGAAYMGLVKAKLQLLGCELHVVSVALPPKGDAFDYFARGGTVEGIASNTPDQPFVQVMGENSVKVTLPTAAGVITFLFSEMDKRRRQFDCILEVSVFSDPEPYAEHLNLDSSSGKTQFRRDLDNLFGKQYDWMRTLNKAINLATEAYLAQERGCDLFDMPDSAGEVMLLPPLIVANGPTIFFGDGSSLKSYLLYLMALCMSLGSNFCGMKAPMLTPMIIDYEDEGPNVKRRVRRLAKGLGTDEVMNIHYWEAKGIPLVDQVDALKRYIERNGIGLLVLDSVAPACGGDPSDPEAVLAFFSALKQLGVPSLLIAHIDKGGNTQKPFGSTFWHNEARRTWFVQRVQEEDSDDLDVGIYCRKANDGRKPSPLAFHVKFSEEERGPVYVALSSMERAPAELLANTSDRTQVWAALGGSPLTIAEIAEATGLGQKTVERVLQKGGFVQAGYGQAGPRGGKPPMRWAREERFATGV